MLLLYCRIVEMLINILVLTAFPCGFEGTTLNFFRRIEDGISKLDSGERRLSSDPLPEYVDWRDRGMVSPVKDQGACAACWAFSIVAVIESHIRIYLNQFDILSEQFLVDCDTNGNGCVSAPLLQSFATIVTHLGGVLRADDYYPYAEKKLKCRWTRPTDKINQHRPMNSITSNTTAMFREKYDEVVEFAFKEEYLSAMPIPVVGFKRVKPDEGIMAQFLYNYGPLSAAINSASMGVYTGGIDEPTDENCNNKNLTHTVLIVGYSTHVSLDTGRRVPYWIIKNSWGSNWGDNGFYYLVRGRNACGIASDVAFPFVS